MALRAVFDANVLISGLVFEGVPGRCLDAVEAGSVHCVTCAAILCDVAEKLEHRFGHSGPELGDELAWLARHAQRLDAKRDFRLWSADSDQSDPD